MGGPEPPAGASLITPAFPDDVRPSRLHAALAAAAAAHPFERKQLVCRRTGAGREVLRALAAAGVPWAGFEATTPLRLAHELVAARLGAGGLEVIDEFDEQALLDAAMDAVLSGATGALARLADGPGLRRAIASSVRTLRHAGLAAADLRAVRLRDAAKQAQVSAILEACESRLERDGRVDSAGLLRLAIAQLESGATTLRGRTYLMPDLASDGLGGRLLGLLVAAGAEVLPADPVYGVARPAALVPDAAPLSPTEAHRTGATALAWLHAPAQWQAVAGAEMSRAPQSGHGEVVLDLFAATSVTAELREVLRRVMAAGLAWDEVEIVATDSAAYGVALDGLADRLDVPVTYAAGLPLSRTRPGRALARYLEWVQRGLPADVLRQLLEAGDVLPPVGSADRVSGAGLARRLRALRVGRGRDAWDAALARLDAANEAAAVASEAAAVASEAAAVASEAAAAASEAGDGADDPAGNDRRAALDRALAALLRPLLATLPEGDDGWSPAALAAGALVLLEAAAAGTAADRSAASRLRQRLQRIRATLQRPTSLAAAVAAVGAELDARLAPPDADGSAPWTSTGGHLHLADLEHGGFSGRRATFIVGLDAGRFPGTVAGDALLVDEDRRRLGETPGGCAFGPLRTEADRIAERRHAFARLVARLRGSVTFSYPLWDAVEGRSLAPSSELLQVYRLISGDAAADYEALQDAVAPAASPVPRGSGLIDGADVWLHVLAHDPAAAAGDTAGGALRWGVPTVCALHPGLARGAEAWKARRRSRQATPHHGAIVPRPQHDPRRSGHAVSATRLETLGACPHRYLLRHVLGVAPPRDGADSPEQWLTPLEKGALLHGVFERTLRTTGADDIDAGTDAFAARALDLLEDGIDEMRRHVAPPGESVFADERERLRDDVRAFVAMVREDGRRHVALELAFGRDAAPPAQVVLPGGSSILLAGAIDRVDELPDDTLLVIDYKTGGSERFQARTGPFDGGRRLQHVLYAAAAERLLGRTVSAAEYQFPSRRSENHRARFGAQHLRDGLAVVDGLLQFVEHGWFVPTNDPEDCRYCDFAAVCRTTIDAYGNVASQPAEWSREADGPAAELMRRLRR